MQKFKYTEIITFPELITIFMKVRNTIFEIELTEYVYKIKNIYIKK